MNYYISQSGSGVNEMDAELKKPGGDSTERVSFPQGRKERVHWMATTLLFKRRPSHWWKLVRCLHKKIALLQVLHMAVVKVCVPKRASKALPRSFLPAHKNQKGGLRLQSSSSSSFFYGSLIYLFESAGLVSYSSSARRGITRRQYSSRSVSKQANTRICIAECVVQGARADLFSHVQLWTLHPQITSSCITTARRCSKRRRRKGNLAAAVDLGADVAESAKRVRAQ